MEWFKRFMYGRYGGDNLSTALLFLSFILFAIFGMLPKSLSILVVTAYIPVFICIFRLFSRNIYKRQMENYKYLRIRNKIMFLSRCKLNMVKDLKTHKYFKCPNCRQNLRVPRKQGKISITCPKCKNSFKAKS